MTSVDVRSVPPAEFAWDDPHGPAAVVRRVRAEAAAADGHDPLDEAAELRLKHRGLADAALWLAGDRGFALLRRGSADGELDVAVAPGDRGHGVGRALATSALAGVRAPVDAWSHGGHPAAAALAADLGFARVRELWVMRRPASPSSEQRDDGIRTFRPGDEQELLRVNAAAFASHPEQRSLSASDLAERMAEPWFDPGGLFLAVDGDRVLGFHWTKVHPGGAGEVYVVGIDPDAQGQGLGKRLTRAGLDHLAGRPVHLYVESDNAPAIAVYSGLGFGHAEADTHVQYHRAPSR